MTQSVATQPARTHKGPGMEGFTAKWYAKLTAADMEEFRTLARRIATEVPAGARVLEVAPGPGYFSIELAKLGDFKITGLDISRTFVEIANENAKQAGVRVDFRRGNASAMPFEDGAFDFILCRAAFKNFAEPVRALEEMYRVLSRGGRAMVIDLRRDTTPQEVNEAIDHSRIGPVNRVVTKLIFRYMLLKRAYTKADFEKMLGETSFQAFEIKQDGFSLEVAMRRAA
jgi:ubiquinone/menaquinone biosynthesis C-methylase UbiE